MRAPKVLRMCAPFTCLPNGLQGGSEKDQSDGTMGVWVWQLAVEPRF